MVPHFDKFIILHALNRLADIILKAIRGSWSPVIIDKQAFRGTIPKKATFFGLGDSPESREVRGYSRFRLGSLSGFWDSVWYGKALRSEADIGIELP